MIKKADLLMAEAIRTVAELYKDGILNKPEIYPYPFSALLEFHDAPNEIEQKLFEMFCKHRARALQGTFHLNHTISTKVLPRSSLLFTGDAPLD